MHCGMLPLDPELHALPRHLHQMLWVESVTQTLSHKPAEKKSVGMQRKTKSGEKVMECSKCHALMVKQAKFCGTCGQKM
jgi:uncharacterized paraquat-inducible protein A